MDSVKHVITRVVSRCEKRGFTPSEALAAFVSRTIVYDNEKRFLMDKEMTNQDLEKLIEMTVARLMEQDSPSLETVKMQVAFDLEYTQSKNKIDEMQRLKTNKMNELQRSIVNIKASSGGGFENFTALYRQIFAFLMLNAKSDVTDDRKDRTAEREVAAALESVFPRVALKSFMTMRNEDKRKQLAELTNIVLGIRLFNHEIGKGGQDLQDVPNLAATTAQNLAQDISENLAAAKKMCQNYTDVLMHVHRNRRRDDAAKMERWQRELTNRRQYVFYAENLAMDIVQSQRAVGAAMEIFNRELKSLKGVVGQRNSVPKEVVYPKFDLLARNWLQMSRELKFIEAYESTWLQVQKFRQSYAMTLPKDLIAQARQSASKMGTDEALDQLAQEEDPSSGPAYGASKVADRNSGSVGASGAKRLTFENTPQIMNLPLELKGYCAHTLVMRTGLLLPGDVESHGVVQYRNHFYSFASGSAAQAFLADPERFINGVHTAARSKPELIHLLGLQDVFPDVSLSKLVDSGGPGAGGVHPLLAPPAATKKDACTETPTHFVEKNIDHNYEWNEWTLRRKAIQLANIRKAKTTGQQTDASHFKQEADTQVYLPRNNGTQTAVNSGTNPVRSHNYIAGLRGFEGKSKAGVNSRYVRNGPNVMRATGSSVINMSFEV